mmetsp:Transcript_3826/g.6011  ORF Transcript_3826/g.6011 Transcript_3826/m.6011 type:complete len:96 (+) Transcript_3826:231-518(+)|eukprot:CAMPEP_0178907738 /NCGR_PEP_ID=MMETSP0786-20121207/7537_1 /TAXON_ID=186022 /ORGANISM="Thalassionema frauenfeldii, Strain CCMP 1798" /LENGTH=95 /DNA_ID=CAMNT_0020579569 /DNA_START=260 /DNA_END=547 /DNA_ORIENTATION=-
MAPRLMNNLAPAFMGKLAAAASQATTEKSKQHLERLLADQQALQSSVNREPYSDPDDRYESMANDYGEFLYEHYEAAIAMIRVEIQKLDAVVSEK